MAAPYNPKGKEIDRLVSAFVPVKTIAAQLKVPNRMIYARLSGKGWRLHYISDEERRFLLKRRQQIT